MGIKPLILAQVETEASSGLAIDIDDEDNVQEIESLQVESADEKDDEVSVYVIGPRPRWIRYIHIEFSALQAPGQSAVESIRELVVCSSEEDYWCRQ